MLNLMQLEVSESELTSQAELCVLSAKARSPSDPVVKYPMGLWLSFVVATLTLFLVGQRGPDYMHERLSYTTVSPAI